MGVINQLDSTVFNRIAAGEVVDRPASVVKELVENSIDSGASVISVEVKDGGKYIKVTDNGCGMEKSDLKTAFLPHATSKIKTLADLDSITTLGFRGEALPSIASVARVVMTSRRKDDELASRIVLENGNIIEESSVGAPSGTCTEVTDLFKNIPARLKFLKSDRSEEGEICSLMQRFILANYNIAISLTLSGKETYRSEGKGLKEAIYSVYGAEFLKETDFIHSSMPDIELFGYINKPAYSKHNRSYQTLIVNGRYVVNSDISFWIYNCYSELLMKRQYPAYVLFINLPADMVDINVHPSKMEVKFVDMSRIKKILTAAIGASISEKATEPKLIELGYNEIGEKRKSEKADGYAMTGEHKDETASDKTNISFVRSVDPVTDNVNFDAYSRSDEPAFTPITMKEEPSAKQKYEAPAFVKQFAFFKDLKIEKNNENYFDISLYKFSGKLFNTYLIFEKGEEAILIDQHAAHEKLLYLNFSEAVENGANSVQDLLFPYIFDVDFAESELIDSHMEEIYSLGFGLNKLSGNSYSISYIPLILSGMDFREFTSSLTSLLERNKLSRSNLLKNEIMQSACKAAIKGDTDISESDVKLLIKDICDKKIELFCPHGRPIAIRISKTEIEKWFKRIV